MVSKEAITTVLNEYLSFEEGEEPKSLIDALVALQPTETVAVVEKPAAKAKKSASGSKKRGPNKYSKFVKHVSSIRKSEESEIQDVGFVPLGRNLLPAKIAEKLDGIELKESEMSIKDLVYFLSPHESNLMKLASLAWALIPSDAKDSLPME